MTIKEETLSILDKRLHGFAFNPFAMIEKINQYKEIIGREKVNFYMAETLYKCYIFNNENENPLSKELFKDSPLYSEELKNLKHNKFVEKASHEISIFMTQIKIPNINNINMEKLLSNKDIFNIASIINNKKIKP